MAATSKFKTAYNYPEGQFCPTGTGTVSIYEHRVNEKGQKTLEKTGKKDVYRMIQEATPDVLIENVINRVIAGDVSMLRPDGSYMDLTKMPKSMVEAQQMIQNMENEWANIPGEIKKKYNWDMGEFIAAAGSKEWLETMGLSEITPMKEEKIEKATITPVEKGEPEA